MTEVLLGLTVLLLLCVLALLAVLARRRSGAEDAQEVRARAATLEGQISELRAQLGEAQARVQDAVDRLSAEQKARIAAETRLDAERRSFEEQRALLDEAQKKLKDAFTALSAEALKDNRTQFLSQAESCLKPVQNLLDKYQEHLASIERARNDAYGGLKQHLDGLAKAQQSLEKEAHQLSTALRSPTVRGRWGEMTLRRVVEVAGMSPHCDFQEQPSVATESGRLRPDMIIRLPHDRIIVVDSKVPLAAYMDAMEARDEPSRQAALARHAQDVRKHVRALSEKAYWDQFDGAADFVVLFLPGESFFSAALEQDRSLMEDAMRSDVFLASPATLIALLHIVAHGWRQEEMAANARQIGEAGRELYERVAKFIEHFSKIGDGLNRAAKAYDEAFRSYESRVRPSAERLAEKAAVTDDRLPEVTPVDGAARPPSLPASDKDATGTV